MGRYQNRLRPFDYRRLFDHAGLEILSEEISQPWSEHQGIVRQMRLAKRFRGRPIDDLAVRAIRIVARPRSERKLPHAHRVFAAQPDEPAGRASRRSVTSVIAVTRIEAVLFDVGGTIVHMPGLPGAIRTALAARGIDKDERTIAVAHKLLSEATEFPDETAAAFYETFNTRLLRSLGVDAIGDLAGEIYRACTTLEWEPCPDVDALEGLGVRLGVVSNWDRMLEDVLARLPVRFEVVIGSSAAGLRKPDPAVFDLAAKRLGLEPERIAYVGDSVLLDAEPAKAAGMTPVLIDRLGIFRSYGGLRARDLGGVASLLGLPSRTVPE